MRAPTTGVGARALAVCSHAASSFWAVPGAMCVVAVLLAQGLVQLDRSLGPTWSTDFGAVGLRAGASGSRDVLGAVAGSMLGVASTTFSITIAVLTLTTSNYGPRLVRNFMSDRANQLVLGTFVSTSLYALLVLRSVRSSAESEGGGTFVPHTAVLVAVLLAVACIGVLIFFVHHISTSVQVSSLSRRVRDELRSVVDRLYPAGEGEPADPASEVVLPAGVDAADAAPGPGSGAGCPVRTGASGYVTGIALGTLLAEARRHDVLVRVQVQPGRYAVDHTELLRVLPAERATGALLTSLRGCVELGDSRTPAQDVEFVVQQLVELLARALSPGTNDPFTAITALDDLSGGLVPMVGRPTPSPQRLDDDGVLRLVAPAVPPVELVDLVLDTVRAYSLTTPMVLLHTAVFVERLDGASPAPALHRRMREHLELLLAAYTATDAPDHDVQRLRERYAPLLAPAV